VCPIPSVMTPSPEPTPGSVDPERIVRSFLRLAAIASPSRGEGALAAAVTAEFRELGWQVLDDRTGPETGNLIARRPGTDVREPLLLATHLDVVPPCRDVRPRLNDGWIESDGTTVLGADAKAGLTALLEVARLVTASPPGSFGPAELVITWGEEVGHLGAKALDRSLLRARRGFVLDGLLPVGHIVVGAPGQDAFSVRIRGRAAHAGLEPEAGISAIEVATQALTRLRWGRLDAETTANLGTMVGGSARNAVPEEARLEGELRSLDAEKLRAQGQQVLATFRSVAEQFGATVDLELMPVYAGYRLPEASAVVELARQALAALGGTATTTLTGGGSDANEFNAQGMECCVLGIGAERCHSVRERVAVSELVRLSDWVRSILQLTGGSVL